MGTRVVPQGATKAASQLITGSLWNAGPYALGSFMLNPPIFRGRQSATQVVLNNTTTLMSLDVTDVDSDSGHSNSVNNTRYTCQVPGWYFVEGYFALTNSGAASRMYAFIMKNGGVIGQGAGQLVNRTTDLQAISASTLVSLNVSDYVEVAGYQLSGSNISTFAGSDLCPSMNVFWISK